MKQKYLYKKVSISLILAFSIVSCEDFVRVDLPNSQISAATVFDNDRTAIAAATGMYYTMLNANGFVGEFHPISCLGGLTSDELVDHTGAAPFSEFYSNQLNVDNSAVFDVWSSGYRTIYQANAVIEGVTTSISLSDNVKAQLEGEAKFVRAFCYFYLVNLFGDIPIVVSTDYRQNATINRTTTTKVYEQIVSDLVKAKELLTEEYFVPGKIRPNKWAATALLARVYLYNEQYSSAETESSEVINSLKYSLSTDLQKVFLANSTESIWELSQVYPYGFPTGDGAYFIFAGYYGKTALSDDLLNSFEINDLRQSSWISSFDGSNYFPFKYKVYVIYDEPNYPENLVLLRLAELYLIRAEARTALNDIEGARNDLNKVRNRAGLPDVDANDQSSLKLAVEQERRFELFTEMGHRWLDLKRTGRADAVLGSHKTLWNPTDLLYPIPEQELLNNPRLTPQNDGY